MKLHTLRSTGVATVAVLALSASLAACGSESDDNAAADNTADSAASEPAAPDTSDASSDAGTENAGDGTFGEGCAGVPADGAGSFNGMVQDPVATAASNNPLLKTLVAAVGASSLTDALNTPDATYTVFAPANDAFAAIPEKDLTGLLDGAKKDGPASALGQILLHHVLPERLDPAAVVGEQDTLNGDTLTIAGDTSGMTVKDSKVTANVLCGNIQTANATVYVIDSVMAGATVKTP